MSKAKPEDVLCCPHCESLGPFDIEGTAVFRGVTTSQTGTPTAVSWLTNNTCRCCDCGHNALVAQFQGKDGVWMCDNCRGHSRDLRDLHTSSKGYEYVCPDCGSREVHVS